jgi:hypothetical protein
MNWYYLRDGQQDGPHSDEALQGFLKSGAIDSATLIWREGVQNWEPISQAAPQLLATEPIAPRPATATIGAITVKCVECGGSFSASEMVSIGGASVCARCKPVRLQKLQEGVAAGDQATDLTRLLKIAQAQRGVNIAILLTFASYAMLMLGGAMAPAGRVGATAVVTSLPLVGLLGVLAALVLQVIYVYRLASSLNHTAIVWVLDVVFLSCIGLILLLILSSKATKELRKAGFKVGLLGGNPKEIKRRMLAS